MNPFFKNQNFRNFYATDLNQSESLAYTSSSSQIIPTFFSNAEKLRKITHYLCGHPRTMLGVKTMIQSKYFSTTLKLGASYGSRTKRIKNG